MATLLSLYSYSSSSFASLTTTKHISFLRAKPSLHYHRPVFLASTHSTEANPELPESVKTFWQWGCDEGVISNKTPVRPGIVPEGIGLVATKDIGRNEVVLEVPKRFWINPDTVADSEIGGVCSGLKPWIAVALFLLREKYRGDSKWKYYLDVLPECTNSTIYWWV